MCHEVISRTFVVGIALSKGTLMTYNLIKLVKLFTRIIIQFYLFLNMVYNMCVIDNLI